MRVRPVLVFLLALGLLPVPSAATPPQPSIRTSQCGAADTFRPKAKPSIRAPQLPSTIAIDGRIQEEAWGKARHVTGFTEIQPGDQTQPEVCTEVLIGYTDSHLYVAFRATDPHPSAIRASLRNRDEIFGDDWIGLLIDPYGDATQAYEIFANPYGIQGDLLMSSTSGEDIGFDLVYESDGRITEDGYEVEMSIPFSSLRFPGAPTQAWNLTFLRTRPRASRYQYSWTAVDRDNPCLMCQFGTLTGIEGVQPSTNVDIIPAVVGTQSANLADADVPLSGLDNNRITMEPSANLRYNFTPSFSAEATVNPDFSQVESDAARIDVNETFALSFPERRPFFQEGSELFETWLDVVYTRSINAPIAAAKTTGRFGRTNVAYLTAVDEKTPMLLPFEEESTILDVGQSFSNIVRARHSFGTNSFVGATLTDQQYTQIGGAGSVASADAKIQLWKNYRLETQIAVSRIAEPSDTTFTDQIGVDRFDRGVHTGALNGEAFAGTGAFVSFDRNARHWSFDLAYEHNSPTFRTPNGFERRNDFRLLRLWQGYALYFDDGAFIERLRPSVWGMTEYDFAGIEKKTAGEIQIQALLKGQTFVWADVGYRQERFRTVEFDRLADWNFNVNSNFSDPVRLGFRVSGGRDIFRTEIPEEGKKLNAEVWGTLQLIPRLTIEPQVRYARMRDAETDSTFFEGYVLRGKTSIQFTRELSLRLITQYNHFAGRVDVEPLLSYEINPFSVFYVGTTHDYTVVADNATRSDAVPLAQTTRRFFFKFQYLFRL